MPLSRTARALSATALTTLALGTATAAATAHSGAEVGPRTVAPGGTVTISVSCESSGGPPPETIDATSQAFEHGTVHLRKAAGGEDPAAEEDPAGGEGPAAEEDPVGTDDLVDTDDLAGTDDLKGDDDPGGGTTYSGTARIAPAANFEEGGPDGVGKSSEWSADGVCPAAPGGEGRKWSASFAVSLGSSRGTEVRHGVHAGEGGTFNDSTIALVSGGLLIAGALGAAVHKLRHRESSSNS
ncbi:hypothetical protein AB0D14_07080 [Streptomyces sp. NPDC048484]|uniref:hypothetical protein n=1 Tax=Streptomyces sp. NPDC048484 TaxID=3155146 RepID=UPI00344A1F68